MPEGDRSLTRQTSKSINMLSKLFSFFQCKHNVNYQLTLEQPDDEVLDNWKHYKNLKAEDVMIPRADIIAMEYTNTLADISHIFLKTRHTRMPVYKSTLDNIVGFINIKDIFPYLINQEEGSKFKIKTILRKLLIISPSMKSFALLEEMRKTRTHIALVVDEFGGTDGLITIEDLVEEIIGKIEDEHDKIESDLKDLGDNRFEASGRTEIEVLEDRFNVKLSDDEQEKYDTLGGLILSISGQVPEKGEQITHSSTGIIFEILDSDPRRIKKVLINLPNQNETSEED